MINITRLDFNFKQFIFLYMYMFGQNDRYLYINIIKKFIIYMIYNNC